MSLPPFAAGSDLPYWLALHRTPAVGSLRFAALLAHFGNPRDVFEAGAAAWQALGLGGQTVAFLAQPDWRSVESDLRWLEGADCHCLRFGKADYPPLLREIADPPPLLFVRGDPASLTGRHLSMVGSRNPTPVGVRTAQDLARGLAEAGFGIVSGLAAGIDAASHRGAIDAAGTTVAIMGTGPDIIYPRHHQALAEAILAGAGAIATEFPPGTGPKAQNFPRRNRIISGLALGTLVVEAAQRSGSLITARLAAEQNREVFAVPGSIYSPQSCGCNHLIQQGAKLVRGVADVLEEFDLAPSAFASERTSDGASAAAEAAWPLLKFIAYDPTTVDTLVAATGETAEAIAAQLLLLELEGYVASAPGGCYIRLK